MITQYNFEDSLKLIDEIKDLALSDFVYTMGKENFKGNKNAPLLAQTSCVCVRIGEFNKKLSGFEIKAYSCLFSVITAILKSASTHLFTQYEGDLIISFFNTRFKTNIEELIDIAAKINSITEVICHKFANPDSGSISCSIGIDYGATYFVDSSYADTDARIVAFGPVRESSISLARKPDKTDGNIYIHEVIHKNLSEAYKQFFSADQTEEIPFYFANLINTAMSSWLKNEKLKQK